jgi:hypothetical protein
VGSYPPGERLMRAALQLAERGMYVFPLRPRSKRPAVRRDWERAATLDPDVIRRVWRSAAYNIGVATGPSRLLVVDLDGASRSDGGCRVPSGRRSLVDAARAAGAGLPNRTFTVVTPRGEHLYFRAPADQVLRNTVGRLGRLVDTRGVGGYVVGPGSVLPSGRYRLTDPTDPVLLPSWIVQRLQPQSADRSASRLPATTTTAYVQAAVRGEAERIARAPVGQRNHALFRASARLGDFVATGRLAESEARAALLHACDGHIGTEGFAEEEVRRTVESGFRRAARHGRPVRADPTKRDRLTR